jgi:chromosome segregation ATPase
MLNSPRSGTQHRWIAVALTLACVSASAQTQPGRKAPKEKPMTRAELRECMKDTDANKAERAAVERDRNDVASERTTVMRDKDQLNAEWERNNQAMKELREKVDTTNAEAVNAYNDKATATQKSHEERRAAVDARVDAWNKRNKAMQEREVAYNDAVKAWNDTCGSRTFRDDDEKAIRAGK